MGYEIRRRTVLYVPERGLLKFFILCSRVSLSPVFRFFRALYLRKNLIQINQVRARPIRRKGPADSSTVFTQKFDTN